MACTDVATAAAHRVVDVLDRLTSPNDEEKNARETIAVADIFKNDTEVRLSFLDGETVRLLR